MPHHPDDPLTRAPSYLLAAGMAGGSSSAKKKVQLFTFHNIVEYSTRLAHKCLAMSAAVRARLPTVDTV